MRDLKQRLGRSYARFATNVAVRFPRLWPLVRPLVRKQFDVLAPVWDTMRSPDAFAPVEAALATLDGPVETALDVGTGTGSAALLIAERFPEARVVGVDIAPEMVERAREKAGGSHEHLVRAWGRIGAALRRRIVRSRHGREHDPVLR